MNYLLYHSIANSAERYAGQIAFRFCGENLGFDELERRSNQLAWALVDNGVKRGDRVGILMHKCIETPVAVYGIMKAGAAYVPLDPGAPCTRLQSTIAHCDIRVLVSHSQKQVDIEAVLKANSSVVCVIGLELKDQAGIRSLGWKELETAPADHAPPVRSMEQDLAYIMYTSGSTGIPKGIMHTHASGLSYARMSAETYGITHEDRLGNHSPLHFDMSTLEYLTAPFCGALTIIVPEAYTKLPASLSQLVEDEQLTIWYSVPFALIQLLIRGLLDQRDHRSLRWVLYGGEPFPPKHLHALRKLWPQARFSNVYGPAEVNQCTYYHIPQDAPMNEEPIPIGTVWPNAEGLILDECDRLVADNAPGELLIRAPTMMQGYWSQPELNDRAFYFRPGTGGNDQRFYRTGDLVRRRDDGNLLFLGRKDRQVKIQGFRVELDEVEGALAMSEWVEEAAAYVVSGDEGRHMIEAAVILKPNTEVSASALLDSCSHSLPRYALPEQVLVLTSFPRTTSGKIDRRALQQLALEKLNEVIGL